MFIDKAAVVGFYRYFKKLQSKLFKRRGLETELLDLARFGPQDFAAV